MMQRPSRPVGITILAVLEILIGIVGLLASLVIIGFSALFSTLPTVGTLLGAVGLIIGGVVLFFSIIWLATGVGFLHGRGWSWTLGMIFSILSLLGAIGALTIGLITGGVGGLIFWGLMLYYLTRTHVKAFSYPWLHNAIFIGPSDQPAANSSKQCCLRSIIGGRSAGRFSASLTRITNKPPINEPRLIDFIILQPCQRRQSPGVPLLSHHASNGHKEMSYVWSSHLALFIVVTRQE